MKNHIQYTAYHDGESASTLLFSPEIETATVALTWREPDRLAILMRELEPKIHFVQVHLCWILGALDIAYGELGAVDFASVVQVLRELNALEEVGGPDAALDVWRSGEFLDSPIWQASGKTDHLFAHYLEMLKNYAIARSQKIPYRRFVRGSGTLYPNKVRKNSSAPDFLGEARVTGKSYQLKGWLSENGQFLNVRFDEL